MSFIQDGPELKNTYLSDDLLKSLLKRALAETEFKKIDQDLTRFGERLIGDILQFSEEAECSPPRHIPYSAFGERIDHIETCRGWKELDKVSAEEGIVAIGYERNFGVHSRFYQFAKLYLFHPSSAFYSCPLAMTDGAARLIEAIGDEKLKEKAFKHITSRDPDEFWTSGQWMTEKIGGSDVGLSESVAEEEGADYKLHGVKFFTSATTSQMTMTLARIADKDGNIPEGSRGLSLFYLELRDEKGKLQNIQVNRLKDKLGTKALPTAELELQGTPAKLIGTPGEGIKNIAILFNVTRIYNAATCVGALRRLLDLSKNYAQKRFAFKKNISEQPLHLKSLAAAEADCQAMLHLTMFTASLLGIDECGSEEEKTWAAPLLRLFTPITKLWTAKLCMQHTSELVEAFGGAGYVEDTGIPRWLRDNQVFSIWEGTTNVLSLDVLRALSKDESYPEASKEIRRRLEKADASEEKEHVLNALNFLNKFAEGMASDERQDQEAASRLFSISLGNIMAASLMLEHASIDKNEKFKLAARKFCEKELCLVKNLSSFTKEEDSRLIY